MSIITTYDTAWVERFREEAQRLRAVLGETARRIEHVGSTSVPGLDAKPVIDIQISVERVAPMDAYRPALEALGYSHLPLPDPPPEVYPFFHKPKRWPTTHHVHVCEVDGEEERRHLAFRDWLRRHPEDREAYAKLKHELARGVADDLAGVARYTVAKGEFVRALESRALGPTGRDTGRRCEPLRRVTAGVLRRPDSSSRACRRARCVARARRRRRGPRSPRGRA